MEWGASAAPCCASLCCSANALVPPVSRMELDKMTCLEKFGNLFEIHGILCCANLDETRDIVFFFLSFFYIFW